MKNKTFNNKEENATTNQYVDSIKAYNFFIKHKIYQLKQLHSCGHFLCGLSV